MNIDKEHIKELVNWIDLTINFEIAGLSRTFTQDYQAVSKGDSLGDTNAYRRVMKVVEASSPASKLKGVYINNIKSLKNTTIDFSNLNLIAGVNSIGKSTLLEAIAILPRFFDSDMNIIPLGDDKFGIKNFNNFLSFDANPNEYAEISLNYENVFQETVIGEVNIKIIFNDDNYYKFPGVDKNSRSIAIKKLNNLPIKKIELSITQDPEKITDEKDLSEYKKITAGFQSGEEYFIDKMSMGIAKIAAAFYPKPVILRTMDFKQEELKSLFCGKYFETAEERNGLIGFRGCARYYSPEYKEAFGLECKAIKKVRDELGLTNLIVMLPFCRNLEECDKVQSVMKEYGLERGVNELQLYLMAEIPSNFVLADKFIEKCDGFSIGSNDITMLALGCDRDSELVSHIYNEEDDSVKELIKMAIKACKKANKKIGICGQGPSDKPEFAKWLMEEGIDSLGLIPESVIDTILTLNKKNDS